MLEVQGGRFPRLTNRNWLLFRGHADSGNEDLLPFERLSSVIQSIRPLANYQYAGDIVLLYGLHDNTKDFVVSCLNDGSIQEKMSRDITTNGDSVEELYPELIYNRHTNTYFYDVPTYRDKPPVAEISIKYFLTKIVKMAKQMKVVIVLSSADVNDNEAIDSLLAYVSEVMPNWRKFKSSFIFLGVAEDACNQDAICGMRNSSSELCSKADVSVAQNPWIVKHQNETSAQKSSTEYVILENLQRIQYFLYGNADFNPTLSHPSEEFIRISCSQIHLNLESAFQNIQKEIMDNNLMRLTKSINIFDDGNHIVDNLRGFINCLHIQNVSFRKVMQCLANYQNDIDEIGRNLKTLSGIFDVVDVCETFPNDSVQMAKNSTEIVLNNTITKLNLYLEEQMRWNELYRGAYNYLVSYDISSSGKSYRNSTGFKLNDFTKDAKIFYIYDTLRPHDESKLRVLEALISQFELSEPNMFLSEDCAELFITGNVLKMSQVTESNIKRCRIGNTTKVSIFAFTKLIIDSISPSFQNQSLTLISPTVELVTFDLKEYLELHHFGSAVLVLGNMSVSGVETGYRSVYKSNNGGIQWNTGGVTDISIAHFKRFFMKTASSRLVNNFEFVEELNSVLHPAGEDCFTQYFINELLALETYRFEEKEQYLSIRKQLLKSIQSYYQAPCAQESTPHYRKVLKDLYALTWSELNAMISTYDGRIVVHLTDYVGIRADMLTNRHDLSSILSSNSWDYRNSKTLIESSISEAQLILNDFKHTTEELTERRQNSIGILLDQIHSLKNHGDGETVNKLKKHLADMLNENILVETVKIIQQHFDVLYAYLKFVLIVTEHFDSSDDDFNLTLARSPYSLRHQLESANQEADRGSIINEVLKKIKNKDRNLTNLCDLMKSNIQQVNQSRKKFLDVLLQTINSLKQNNDTLEQCHNLEASKKQFCDIVVAFVSSNTFEEHKSDPIKLDGYCDIIMELSDHVHMRDNLELSLAPMLMKINDYLSIVSGRKSTHSEFIDALDSISTEYDLEHLNTQILQPLAQLSYVSKDISQVYQDLIFSSTRFSFISSVLHRVSHNRIFMQYVEQRWDSSSEITLFKSAPSNYLENMLFSNLAYAEYLDIWHTAKDIDFPYVSDIPDRDMEYDPSTNNHDIRSVVLQKLKDMQVALKYNEGVSQQGLLYVWNNEQYANQIYKVLAGEEAFFEADIFRGFQATSEASKIHDVYFVIRAHRNESQAALDNVVQRLEVESTHAGLSVFNYCHKYYIVNTATASIHQFYRRIHDNRAGGYNNIYLKLHEGNPILSPYTKWKIKLEDITSSHSVDLSRYNGQVDLELHGTVISSSTFRDCSRSADLGRYYKQITPFYYLL